MQQESKFYRKIAATDIKVSAIGLGTVKFGRNEAVKYPNNFTIPDDRTLSELLNNARELGINLLDTAPAYGVSEERLGKLLIDRHKWIICCKAGEEFVHGGSSFDFSATAIKSSVARSLKRLQTDYIDILLIHSNGDDVNIINNYEVFSTMEKLKQDGMIRSYGMSTKTVEGGILTVNNADIAMITYNPEYLAEYPVILEAEKLNKSVFIKKALASGHLNKLGNNPIESSFRLIFQNQAVASAIIGTINKKHLQENCLIANSFL